MKSLPALAGAVLLAFGAACTPSTPASRIAANPELYGALSAKHQELVSQGRLAKGMTQPAVFLAWGHPARKGEGYKDGKSFERWDYARYRPVYYNNFYGYYGYGRHHYHGFGYGPTVDYVPYRSASVWFRNGRADSWERLGPYR